jgi:hypothetical protein
VLPLAGPNAGAFCLDRGGQRRDRLRKSIHTAQIYPQDVRGDQGLCVRRAEALSKTFVPIALDRDRFIDPVEPDQRGAGLKAHAEGLRMIRALQFGADTLGLLRCIQRLVEATESRQRQTQSGVDHGQRESILGAAGDRARASSNPAAAAAKSPVM